jgi:unsaturated chondroitin disaccharide hydrolase
VIKLQRILETFEKASIKINHVEKKLSQFPHITKGGEWLTYANGHWTGGFWTGLLWLDSLYNDQPSISYVKALKWAEKLKTRMNDNKTHDMGFIFGPSCIMGHRITLNEELVEMAESGAENLTDLYKEQVGLILAWDEPGYEGVSIVDTIMNLPILIWVAEKTNQPQYRELANQIADRILELHVRKDSSIYHVVRWDPITFEVVEKTTHQGYSSESCWSRGQAWALYGFANMFRYSGKRRYLEASEKLSKYFWGNLDDQTGFPKWDFVFKNDDNEPIDTSAAAIASSGMLLLSNLFQTDNQHEKSKLWFERGKALTHTLIDHSFYKDINRYGIIENATVDKPRNSGVGESTMYGDYYFMESLFRLLNRNNPKMLKLLY